MSDNNTAAPAAPATPEPAGIPRGSLSLLGDLVYGPDKPAAEPPKPAAAAPPAAPAPASPGGGAEAPTPGGDEGAEPGDPNADRGTTDGDGTEEVEMSSLTELA